MCLLFFFEFSIRELILKLEALYKGGDSPQLYYHISTAGWPGGWDVSIIQVGNRSGGGSAGWTAAAAGSGWTCWLSQERSAPSPSRVLCCRLCLTSQEKKETGNQRSSPTPSAFRRAGWRPALRERHRRGTCYASRRQRSLRLSPPTPGLARSVRRSGAQLDLVFAFYAPRRRLRVRPGGAAVGCAAGHGIALYASRRRLRAWRRVRRRGAHWQLDGESAFNASRRQLRALPGEGGGGALSWTGSSLSTPPAADVGPGPEEATEGCAAGQGIALYAFGPGPEAAAELDGEFASPPTSGQARRRRRLRESQQSGQDCSAERALYLFQQIAEGGTCS